MPSLYSLVSTQSGRSTNCIFIEGKHTNNLLLRSRKLWQEYCWWDIQNFTSVTHPVIWTHFILANLPFQDFPNHIYCLQHLKRIWGEAVHDSPGRMHSCNHPPLHWKIQGCWQLLGPYSHAMPNRRWLAFLLDFCSTEKLFLQAEWRFFSLSFHLPLLLLSHCHHISRKTQNEPYFYSRSLQPSRLKGWELTSLFPSLPPESTFTYKVPLTTSMCSLHLLPLLSSVFCHRPSSSLASSLG